MSDDEDPWDISTAIWNSDAAKVKLRIDTLGLNYYVFRRNYEELTDYLAIHTHPSMAIQAISDMNHGRLNVTVEIVRLFHNFLAAAKTLVDHTRVVIRDWYQGTDFYKEYSAEIRRRFPEKGLHGSLRSNSLTGARRAWMCSTSARARA